ncbi:hypothetical protein ACHAWF_002425, partial [Thalassiosira exigua]
PQTTTTRCLFYGACSTPRTLQVVFRDDKKTEAALEAKHGKVPDGYLRAVLGTGLSRRGHRGPLARFQSSQGGDGQCGGRGIAGSVLGYRLRQVEERQAVFYDPVAKWFLMCKLLKKDLANITRKPKVGWSCENVHQQVHGIPPRDRDQRGMAQRRPGEDHVLGPQMQGRVRRHH